MAPRLTLVGPFVMNIPAGVKCSVINCGAVAVSKGLCDKHRKRLERHGTVSDEFGKAMVDGKNLNSHPLYNTWRSITRVKRGTLVCDRWKNVSNFIADVVEKPPEAHAFRRIDKLGMYELNNVYWCTIVNSEKARKSKAQKAADLRKVNPDYFKNSFLKRTYGITLADWQQMYDEQGGVCKICGKSETKVDRRQGIIRSLSVDHCHETGNVRGLLCSDCNTAIGLFQHSGDLLVKAIEYCRNT